jgi:DNA polymerase IV
VNPEVDDSGAVDILHLDMDSFFAAVEVREDPALAGRPVVVGGAGPRGVVASASYAARRFGVRSAMPTGLARRLCPQLVVVSPSHGKYSEVSAQLIAICHDVTPIVEPLSLDEAFLDVSGAHELFGESRDIALGLRQKVRDELGLSCAIGVARTKLIAKLASKAAKPKARLEGIDEGAGVVVVRPAEELEFLHHHPVRAVPGVGPRTADRLGRVGVSTVGDLALLGNDRLVAMFGSSHGASLFDLAWGRDGRRVEPDRELRSIGHEATFDVDDYDAASLESKVREMAVSVAARCRERGLAARTVSLKVRYADFETVVRSKTERRPVEDGGAVSAIGAALLSSIDVGRGVRLVGVSVSSLEPSGERGRQLELFGESGSGCEDEAGSPGKGPAAEVAADEVRKKFGEGAISSVAAFGRRASRRGSEPIDHNDAPARRANRDKRATAPSGPD